MNKNEVPDYAAMQPGEMLATLGTDAFKWAQAFMQMATMANPLGRALRAYPDSKAQDDLQGTMIGWFANAMGAVETKAGERHDSPLNTMAADIHQRNVDAGWWTDLTTGERKDRNVGELLMLVVSEVAEAMEGHRKSLPDDKLPHRAMFEVELADVFIRIFDIAGAHGLDLDGAVREKLAYNAQREDHKIETRKAAGGKAY